VITASLRTHVPDGRRLSRHVAPSGIDRALRRVLMVTSGAARSSPVTTSSRGKEVSQRADLMDFDSLHANGAYFGPEWGTDYLHRLSARLRDLRAQRDFGPATRTYRSSSATRSMPRCVTTCVPTATTTAGSW
jgi:hypothetical protein